MLQSYLLSILIFLPLIAATVIVLLPASSKELFKYLALGVGIIQVVLGILLYTGFDNTGFTDYTLDSFYFVERASWIEFSLGDLGWFKADYLVGVDGTSGVLVLLSIGVLLVGVISSWNITEKVKGYFVLYLILNAAIVGCFASLDFLLFYLFFEFMLLPMYFLIGLWGGPRRDYASIKFFLYTLIGSILILVVMIALYLSVIDPAATAVKLKLANDIGTVSPQVIDQVQALLNSGSILPKDQVHTFNMIYMADAANFIPGSILDSITISFLLNQPARLVMFLLLFIGFAIKIPVVPLHTWLPDAHVEAPTPISVVLAGILLKVGGYGLIRTAYYILPDGAVHYSWFVAFMGVLSIIYGAMNALSSKDLKRLVAYSSVSHMGFVLLGLAALTSEGVSGAIYQMVSHGIISAALFIVVGVLYDRTKDRLIDNYSGLANQLPKYTAIVIIFFFASMGLPGFSGFIAEIFVLLGSFSSPFLPKWMTIVAATGLVLSAAYYLWTIQRMFFGKYHIKLQKPGMVLEDLTTREYLMLVPLATLALALGLFPSLITDMLNTSVNTFVDLVQTNGMANLKSLKF